MESFILKTQDLSVKRNSQHILKNINFQIKQNELISVVGKNGSGKSTLCKVITNNMAITSGLIITKPNLNISYIPQAHNYNFIMPICVKKLLILNNKNSNSIDENMDLIKLFKLDKLLNSNFKNLSGGEKQKTIILRALLKKPELLIMDEAETFIDFQSKNYIYSLINDIRKNLKMSVLMVSHDINLVLKDTNWVLCINNGEIGCQGHALTMENTIEFNKIFDNNWSYYQHKDTQQN
jgi:zinc transport system ATP-binding protein